MVVPQVGAPPPSSGGSSSGSGNDDLVRTIRESLLARINPASPREGAIDDTSNGARQADEDTAKEEPCFICMGSLPNTGRSIIHPCGHVFCSTCIRKWTKNKARSRCPTCHVEFNTITKTLTPKDIAREEARLEFHRQKTNLNKNQKKRQRKKLTRVKTPAAGVKTKTFRIRDPTKKSDIPAAPTPQRDILPKL
eukprot:g13987.t1